ncbi:hypothetical protein [Actinomadura sp. DC4]|uniref:hypothetical protein n=1 Tax=Actinomadura sp. DC4 TaxID=3055069 RepID=UPI0025B07EFA|nr:hypothetical protein [Actinomadura sp. DC4]MDN3351562.1 hypothetical protein [Actinomadura sp. DC4]
MSVLFVCVVAIAAGGVALLAWMFRRDDSRLGMAGLGVLIAANVLAMVHAALNSA